MTTTRVCGRRGAPPIIHAGVDIQDHNTRSSHSYRSHRARIKVKQVSMHCIGPDMWNKLPDSLKDVQSLGSFKSLLKKNVARTKVDFLFSGVSKNYVII